MLFLWVFGRAMEERLGAGSLLLLFLFGGLVAALGYVGLHSEATRPLVGASGAIAAIMGAYLVLRPRERVLSLVYAAGLQVVYLPAWAILGLFFVTQFFTPGQDGVAWEAHVIGMVFGAVTGLCVRRFVPSHPTDPAAQGGSPSPHGLRTGFGQDHTREGRAGIQAVSRPGR
jgi:membrane associated rhomboid family serine protease